MNTHILIQASEKLSLGVRSISFPETLKWIYNPLEYAKEPHDEYIRKFAGGRKRVLFLGMNPGPWGMAQTGVPFGEIRAVREWMGIEGTVGKPRNEHPKRPIEGFSCTRSEVSGRRLWGLMERKFHHAHDFFADHYVINYCPLVFMEESGKNSTPEKLPVQPRNALEEVCREHVSVVIQALEPEYLVGIGAYAEKKLHETAQSLPGSYKIFKVLHPSPASPLANRGWENQAEGELVSQGVW